MSKAHLPPVPPASRTTKGPGPQDHHEGERSAEAMETGRHAKDRNVNEQGRQGNVKQNTTNQGFQQDR